MDSDSESGPRPGTRPVLGRQAKTKKPRALTRSTRSGVAAGYFASPDTDDNHDVGNSRERKSRAKRAGHAAKRLRLEVTQSNIRTHVEDDSSADSDTDTATDTSNNPRKTKAAPKKTLKRKISEHIEPTAAAKRSRRDANTTKSRSVDDDSDHHNDTSDTDEGAVSEYANDDEFFTTHDAVQNYGTSKNSRKRKSESVALAVAKRARLGKKQPASHVTPPAQRSRVKGKWGELPLLIWQNVFEFTAAPLHDANARDQDVSTALQTLLSAVGSFRKLTQPALEALYKSPVLPHTFPTSTLAVHTLAKRINLAKAEGISMFNYRPMVRILRIEVDTMLSKKYAGEYLDLKNLMQNLPNLEHVELFHHHDLAPYRNLETHVRWKYPDELFEALDPLPGGSIEAADKMFYTKLLSWNWSSRLAGPSHSLDKIAEIHRTHPSFKYLRKIKFINYQLPSMSVKSAEEVSDEDTAKDAVEIERLAGAIKALPNLEHLVLESSTMVNGQLLGLLPTNLKRLELINCWEVTAEALAAFLMTHGSWLEQLTLNHCQSLSLAFLPVLRSACPKLKVLQANLMYYRHHEFYNDASPFYKELIAADQVPSWPPWLQTIEIQHMGFDTHVDAANMFFRSLEESTKVLPDLRRLCLKSTLNIPVRERAKFRDFWTSRMSEVFQRPSEDPKPVRRRAKGSQTPSIATKLHIPTSTRRSSRIAHQVPSPVPSARMTSDDTSSDEDLVGAAPGLRQGRCEVVDIQVDNKKLTERQYAMVDFVDSPDDDDDGWDGTYSS